MTGSMEDLVLLGMTFIGGFIVGGFVVWITHEDNSDG